MNIIIALSILGLLAIISIIRYHWINAQTLWLTIATTHYVMRKKPSNEEIEQMVTLWPRSHQFYEIWRWDFSRYAVYPEMFNEVMVFARKDMENPNLNVELVEEARKGKISINDAENPLTFGGGNDMFGKN